MVLKEGGILSLCLGVPLLPMVRLELHKCSTLFRTTYKLRTLSWCQISGKIQGGIYSDRTYAKQTTTTTTPINSRRNLHTHSISRGFSRGLCEYSDFFQDHKLQPQHIGDVRRDYIHFCGLELGLESSCFNPSQLRPIQELQSFEQRYENIEHYQKAAKSHRKLFSTHLPRSCNG